MCECVSFSLFFTHVPSWFPCTTTTHVTTFRMYQMDAQEMEDRLKEDPNYVPTLEDEVEAQRQAMVKKLKDSGQREPRDGRDVSRMARTKTSQASGTSQEKGRGGIEKEKGR